MAGAEIEAGFEAGGEPVGQNSADLIVSAPGVERPLIEIHGDMASPLPAEGGDAHGSLAPYFADYWLHNPEVAWSRYLAMDAEAVSA